jgi:CRISPR-associated protein Csy3
MTLKTPSVLALQRGSIVTDGLMYSRLAGANGAVQLKPISVVRHGIRGINTSPKADSKTPGLVQRTESAKTSPGAIGLVVKFAYRTLPADQLLFACADLAYRNHLEAFIQRYFNPGVAEFDEVCLRLARNILNGRWLWRNQMLGAVKVTASTQDKAYSGEGSRQRDFENYTQDERDLAKNVIAAGLIGANIPVRVEGHVDFGFDGAVEVFPSQNMVTKKPDGFARSLYKVEPISFQDLRSILNTSKGDGEDAEEFCADMIRMGHAALRDQKIGNAIRTIDTWYPASPTGRSPSSPMVPAWSLTRSSARKPGPKTFCLKLTACNPAMYSTRTQPSSLPYSFVAAYSLREGTSDLLALLRPEAADFGG